MPAKLAVQHGESWANIQSLTEEELNQRLDDEGLSVDGTIEDRQRRLWYASLPVYPIPPRLRMEARIVFAGVLDEDHEPRPEGVDRQNLIEQLIGAGFPDEETAAQAVETQIENLVLYYGYRQVPSSADVIIVERRQ